MAGKVAKSAGLYHGAVTGIAYVLLEIVGLVPAPFALSGEALSEGLAIIAGDALLLAVAAGAGWIADRWAGPWSSSGKDRGR